MGKWFLEAESAAGDDAVKTVDVTTKDLEDAYTEPIEPWLCLRGRTPVSKDSYCA